MNRILTLCAAVAALSLTACASSGGNAGTGLVKGGVEFGALHYLNGAKTQAKYDSRKASVTALADALKEVRTEGLKLEELRPLLIAKFGGDPETVVLIDIATDALGDFAGTGPIQSAWLDSVATGLERSLAFGPPVFAAAPTATSAPPPKG